MVSACPVSFFLVPSSGSMMMWHRFEVFRAQVIITREAHFHLFARHGRSQWSTYSTSTVPINSLSLFPRGPIFTLGVSWIEWTYMVWRVHFPSYLLYCDRCTIQHDVHHFGWVMEGWNGETVKPERQGLTRAVNGEAINEEQLGWTGFQWRHQRRMRAKAMASRTNRLVLPLQRS